MPRPAYSHGVAGYHRRSSAFFMPPPLILFALPHNHFDGSFRPAGTPFPKYMSRHCLLALMLRSVYSAHARRCVRAALRIPLRAGGRTGTKEI